MIDSIIDWITPDKPWRTGLKGFYRTSEHDKTVRYAQKNMSLNGVKELYERTEKEYQSYLWEMENIINDESAVENEKFNKWEKINKIKNIFKYGAIAFALFTIICLILQSNLAGFGIVILIMAIFVGCVLKVMDIICEKQYNSYIKTVKDKFNSVNNKYIQTFNVIYSSIDNLYLSSLDPTHREMVLMRRDQERQHQEAMRANARQAEIQRKLAEEQKRLRIQQDELLQIEKERERRYKY